MYKVSIDFEGKEYSLEAGKYAKFANGAVMVRCGDTMVLVTAVASAEDKAGIDFLPLSIEYREKLSAAGKIPGGFLKREGRPSEKEILVSRLIDRPLRPLFPKSWFRDTQIVCQVFSADPDVDPENITCVGASAALLISDIPFNGPVSEVRVGRLNGQFIANPTDEQLKECDIDMTVAGSETSIIMVEGESKEISEEEYLDAINFAHIKIKELNQLQRKLAEAFSKPKKEVVVSEIPEDFIENIKTEIQSDLKDYVYSVTTKDERSAKRNELRERALKVSQEKFSENEEYASNIDFWSGKVFGKLEKKQMRAMILEDKKRLDGRGLEDIRPISTEVSLLPRVHGSALFTRGETQSLTSVTLGSATDEQMIDGLLPTYTQRFFLHYNFPPFSVGETGRFGGTGRREIGHGNLAQRALEVMLPSKEDFKYTIRVVSDILESNGSSSMATVCAGSMALMDAGVPMKKPVAGIAMGLIKEENDFAILSDILGDEDFLGDMDFKVAGTTDGITACQMDIKIEGLSIEQMSIALQQAKRGRMHILGKMAETLSVAKDELSPYAPRLYTLKIKEDEIGMVIGSGGSNIREIVAQSGAQINIEDDGTVIIAATTQDSADIAIAMINKTVEKPEAGKIYTGTVKEVREGLGALIEILPKQVGLLHISQIAWEKTENVGDHFKKGDKVEVLLEEIGRDGKYKLSRRALLPKPEGYVERPPREPRENRGEGDRGNRRDFDRRGGRDGRNDRYDRNDRNDDRRRQSNDNVGNE